MSTRIGVFGGVLAAVLAMMIATGCDPWKSSSPPSAGTYRIENLDSMRPSGDALTTPLGKIAIFQVDYQGPREWAEIVVEHWRGEALLSTDVLFRARFGCRYEEKVGYVTHSKQGPAFLHPSDLYSVWLTRLGEPYPPGVNSFAYVKVLNKDLPRSASVKSSQLDLPAHRDGVLSTEEGWMRIESGESRIIPDSEPTLLWHKAASIRSTADPVATPEQFESRIYFRLVAS